MIRWRIYYADDSTFSYLDGGPETAPVTGVQVVKQEKRDRPGEHVDTQGKPTWLWRGPEDGWWPADEFGYWQYMLCERGPKIVLFGTSIRNEDFWRIANRAAAEALP